MLCGISTSFPVLSPNRRQVAHALLTRPPLFHPRRDFTVRLECVMHAASVNPEPGSNSLKNVYLNPLRDLNPFSELLFNLASFYFLSFSQCVLTRTTLFSVFSHFLVVQFSMSDFCFKLSR